MIKKQSFLSRANAFVVYLGEKLSWIYLFIVLISVYEVMMRYVFGRPTVWVHETSLSLAAIVMVYGGLFAYAKNKHITVSVVVDLLPKKLQVVFGLIADVLGFLYVIFLTASALMITRFAIFAPDGSIRLERSGSSWNSIFPSIIKVCMTIFLLMFLALALIHIVSKCVSRKKVQAEESK